MKKERSIFALITFFCFVEFFLFCRLESAKADGTIIRDAESEKFLHELSDPIFTIAGLDSKNIKIYIINDNSINAFVSGGQNVFINTGLIRQYKTPDTLIGVIAHETGHIAAGHLARSSENAQSAQNAMLLSYLLGIGAAVGGSPDAAAALILGGSQTAQRLYMKFTRTQEEAADSLAVNYLQNLKYSPQGLINLLEFFETQSIGYKDQIDEYLLSHPVSRKRINAIKAQDKKKFSNKKLNEKLQNKMSSVLAKLEGFLENPDDLIKKYKNSYDYNSRYIKAIAFYRKGEVILALENLDSMIKENPKDGFLFELKGQFLFEAGLIEESIIAYSRAVKLLSIRDSALIKINFASAILSLKTNDKDLLEIAIKNLQEAKNFESDTPILFKQLANAYLRNGEEARSLLALSEFHLLIGDKEKCLIFAKKAKDKIEEKLKEGSEVQIKNDLIYAEDLIEEAKEKK